MVRLEIRQVGLPALQLPSFDIRALVAVQIGYKISPSAILLV